MARNPFAKPDPSPPTLRAYTRAIMLDFWKRQVGWRRFLNPAYWRLLLQTT